MLRLAGERDTLNVVSDQYGAPTSAALLADIKATVVERIAKGKAGVLFGAYHASAGAGTNWHSYARRVIERARRRTRDPRRAGCDPSSARSHLCDAGQAPDELTTEHRQAARAFRNRAAAWEKSVNALVDEIL